VRLFVDVVMVMLPMTTLRFTLLFPALLRAAVEDDVFLLARDAGVTFDEKQVNATRCATT